MIDEDRIRRALAPYTFDGTEAVERILTLVNSPARPYELRAAIRGILERQYRDTVPVAAVVDYMGDESES
jgi:hypothetical protein